MTTHGYTYKRIHHVWCSMRQRCTNPKKKDYKNYGGRGITICQRWDKFENFLEDMGEPPKGLTLDRKDNDGNYEKDNCSWATHREQNRNNRHTKLNSLRVKNIKQCIKKGDLTYKTLGYIFGVDPTSISHIASGKNWADITI